MQQLTFQVVSKGCKKSRIVLSLLGVCLAFVTLSGCVTSTTSTGGTTITKDDEKALETHVQLASGYYSKGNRESARHHVQKAFAFDKNSAGAHNVLALIYEQEGEMKLADEHFHRALKDKEFTGARYNYGGFLLRRERYSECFEQFEEVSKDLHYAKRATAMSLMGVCALRSGRKDKALAVFNHAVTIDGKQSIALIELAEAAFEKKEYEKTKRYLDQFEKVSSKSARSLWLGIRIEQIFGNKDKEASYLLQLKNLHPYSKEYLAYKKSQNK
ncbi:MAG: type IV pilus biogenesis/stability protein PilW [Cellvibrionaceae bacterium]